MREARLCPICKKEYSGYPAMSRIDGSEICTRCSIVEALEAAGFPQEVIDAILVEIDEASPPAE